MQRFLVIGATGVAGSAGIEAIRRHFDEAHITALWYGRENDGTQVEGADLTLFGDITDPACLDGIASAAGEDFDWCLYATALGDVGFPSDRFLDGRDQLIARRIFQHIAGCAAADRVENPFVGIVRRQH